MGIFEPIQKIIAHWFTLGDLKFSQVITHTADMCMYYSVSHRRFFEVNWKEGLLQVFVLLQIGAVLTQISQTWLIPRTLLVTNALIRIEVVRHNWDSIFSNCCRHSIPWIQNLRLRSQTASSALGMNEYMKYWPFQFSITDFILSTLDTISRIFFVPFLNTPWQWNQIDLHFKNWIGLFCFYPCKLWNCIKSLLCHILS